MVARNPQPPPAAAPSRSRSRAPANVDIIRGRNGRRHAEACVGTRQPRALARAPADDLGAPIPVRHRVPMTIGVKYLTYPDHSGYGLAALGYVRALHNAGMPVWWSPLACRGNHHVAWRPDDGLDDLLIACEVADDAARWDVAALAAVAERPRTGWWCSAR